MKTKLLNIERLRSIHGFEKITQIEAEHILNAIKEYSIILFSVYKGLKKKRQVSLLN